MTGIITPDEWEDVVAVSYQDAPPGPLSGYLSYTYNTLLDATAMEPKPISIEEDEVIQGEIVYLDTDDFFVELYDSDRGVSITEGATPFIRHATFVYNDNPQSPGIDIELEGMLEDASFDRIDIFWRDVAGRYGQVHVRGAADVPIVQNTLKLTDYELPLSTEVRYFITFYQGADRFTYGPLFPEPYGYIPTLKDNYGGGTAYMKPIDVPQLSRPVMIDEFDSWTRPANVLAEHHIIGRRNKVVLTDVRGGREGSLSGHCILSMGQSVDELEKLLDPGATILIQNIHPDASAFPANFYVQVKDASFERKSRMIRHGLIEEPQIDTVVSFDVSFTEVDRPDPTGELQLTATWDVVHQTFFDWAEVRSERDSWLNVLQRPVGPGGIDS